MRVLAFLIALSAIAGCGGDGIDASGGSGGNGGGGGGSGGGGGGGGGGGPVDGSAPTDGPVINVDDEKAVITMTPFDVTPGQEVFKCQTFANPFGSDTEVTKFRAAMSAGSHHMLLLFDDSNTNGAIYDCNGLTFGPMPFASQQPEAEVVYPDGIAALVKANQGFMIVSHYLNASPSTIHTTIELTLTKAKPGTITQHAGVFFLNNVSALNPTTTTNGVPGGVPPHTKRTITAEWTTPREINLLSAVGHMHRRTLSLTAQQGDNVLYTTDSWDNAPLQLYNPVTTLPAGTTLTWSCVIDNDTDQTLVFGESANTNEMCIFDGQYYPVANDDKPSILVTR